MSPSAKMLLGELQARPEWEEILDKLACEKPPVFNKNRDRHADDWVFWSGRFRENERILTILKGE